MELFHSFIHDCSKFGASRLSKFLHMYLELNDLKHTVLLHDPGFKNARCTPQARLRRTKGGPKSKHSALHLGIWVLIHSS